MINDIEAIKNRLDIIEKKLGIQTAENHETPKYAVYGKPLKLDDSAFGILASAVRLGQKEKKERQSPQAHS